MRPAIGQSVPGHLPATPVAPARPVLELKPTHEIPCRACRAFETLHRRPPLPA